MTDPAATEVLDFWFGTEPAQVRAEWFGKHAGFDRAIEARFGALVETALQGGIDAWAGAPRAALARVIVLDQFTRNLYRDQARAFAGDALALAAAQALVASGWHLLLPPVERWFAYLPFEHAEDLPMQNEAMRLFGDLARDEPSLASPLEWAAKHQAVVARFGRFPHRNAALGRASSAEEIAFLAQPGSRF